MDYYYHEFLELQKDFEKCLKDFPLFHEMIDEIYDNEIKEINELLEKNDEYYLKKAISKLQDVIDYIKKTSTNIDYEYNKFDKLAGKWEKVRELSCDEKELERINNSIMKANNLIKSHNLKDIKEANLIIEKILKSVK